MDHDTDRDMDGDTDRVIDRDAERTGLDGREPADRTDGERRADAHDDLADDTLDRPHRADRQV